MNKFIRNRIISTIKIILVAFVAVSVRLLNLSAAAINAIIRNMMF